MVVFAYDRGDYDEEILKIKESARIQAKRDDFRIAICSDKKLIKKLKKSTNWFKDESLSSIVLKRYDGEYISLGLMEPVVLNEFNLWVSRKSLKDVEELSDDLLFIQNQIG